MGMRQIILQSAFYKTIESDQRISSTHISLYMALLHECSKSHFQGPIVIDRSEIMKKAKISSRVTYNKRIKELHEYKYIEYQPSFKYRGSLVNIRIPVRDVG